MNERDRQLIDALQDSLERIEAGLSPAEALARHAALREDLAPRLEAAMTLRAHRPAAAPAFDASLRARLEAVDAEANRGILIAFERWQAPLMRAAAVLLAVGLALGTASYAAASRLPDDHWLRPLALRIDRVRAVVWDAAESVLPDAMRPTVHRGAEEPVADLDHDSSEATILNGADAGSSVKSAEFGDPDGGDSRDKAGTDGSAPILRQADARGLIAAQRATAAALRSASLSVPPDSGLRATAMAPILRLTVVAQLPAPSQPTAEAPTAPVAPTEAPEVDPPKEDPPKEDPEPTQVPVPTATAAPPQQPGPPGGGQPGEPGEPGDPDPPATGVIEGVARWNDDGRPLSRRFKVVLIAADACPRGPGSIAFVGVTKTDDEGRFRFETLAAGLYKVGVRVGIGERGQEFFVWAPGEWDCDRAASNDLLPGQTLEVEIRVRDFRGGPGPGGAAQDPPRRDPGHQPPGATALPTLEPTAEPTAEPTVEPTVEPTAEPTVESTTIEPVEP